MIPKIMIIISGIYLLYITSTKIMRVNKGEKVQILDNILAIILGSILAVCEWNTMYNEGWHLYYLCLVAICGIVPIYCIIKKYIV